MTHVDVKQDLTNGPNRDIIRLSGPVAQLGERCVRNAEVMGSNPTRSTTGCRLNSCTRKNRLFLADFCYRKAKI